MRRTTVLGVTATLVLAPTVAGATWQRSVTKTATWSAATLGTPTLSATCSGALGGGLVTLTWSAAANATGYAVSRTGGSGPLGLTATLATVADTIPILSLATTFTYTVKATAGSAWTGPASNTKSVAFGVLGCSVS